MPFVSISWQNSCLALRRLPSIHLRYPHRGNLRQILRSRLADTTNLGLSNRSDRTSLLMLVDPSSVSSLQSYRNVLAPLQSQTHFFQPCLLLLQTWHLARHELAKCLCIPHLGELSASLFTEGAKEPAAEPDSLAPKSWSPPVSRFGYETRLRILQQSQHPRFDYEQQWRSRKQMTGY